MVSGVSRSEKVEDEKKLKLNLVYAKDKIHLKKIILDESCLYKIQDSSRYFDCYAVTGCERSCFNLNETCVLYRQGSK